jgi:hypothetical protein
MLLIGATTDPLRIGIATVRFGSLADYFVNITLTAGSGGKAAVPQI